VKRADASGRISLWLLAVPVTAWGLHFLAVYVIAAIYCAKAGTPETAAAGPLATVRWWVVAVTAATFVAYVLTAWRGYAGLRSNGRNAASHEQAFLGAVALMLCAFSAAASLFLASVPFFFGDCRP
jgi:hypothetical protein